MSYVSNCVSLVTLPRHHHTPPPCGDATLQPHTALSPPIASQFFTLRLPSSTPHLYRRDHPSTRAIRTSTEAEFSQANIVPMAVAIGTIAPYSIPGAALNGLLALGYIFFGFVKNKPEAE